MLLIDVLTLHPELLKGPFSHSIMKRAQDRSLLKVRLHDLKEYGIGKQKQVDDYSYGGGAGMVMMIEPLVNAVEKLQEEGPYDEVIYMSPDGQRFDQGKANRLSLKKRLLIICGHYKGVDERFRETWVTMEISIGDYVLTGGELAAAVVVDAIGRLIPGVLNDESSALTDSFQDGLLAPPVYTRPAEYRGLKVPNILLSGHEAKVEEWRHEMALNRTMSRRPDLLLDDADEQDQG